jgi:hypothetical protein
VSDVVELIRDGASVEKKGILNENLFLLVCWTECCFSAEVTTLVGYWVPGAVTLLPTSSSVTIN